MRLQSKTQRLWWNILSFIKSNIMETYSYTITDFNPKDIRKLQTISRIANQEKTGFFIDYKDPVPVLNKAIVTINKNVCTLTFKSEDVLGVKFKVQLAKTLKTLKIIQNI